MPGANNMVLTNGLSRMRGDSHVRFLGGRRRSNALLLPDIGVDDESSLVHSVVGTAANVVDVTQVDKLLHDDENEVCADAGYT